MTEQLNIILIRHGLTKANEEHRYLGTTDESLSEAGRAILEALWSVAGENAVEEIAAGGKAAEEIAIDRKAVEEIAVDRKAVGEASKVDIAKPSLAEVSHVFVSPMKRCIETAKLLLPGVAQTKIPEFCEIDFGTFEGKNYEELSGDADYQAWIDSGGTMTFPGGESREEFIRRTMVGFRRMVDLCYLEGHRNIACVVHGGTIMAICSSVLGGEYFDYQLKNGEFMRLIVEMKN